MSRFDKYEPRVGGFRARLEANWLLADVGILRAVSLNASGRVVKGKTTGQPGLKGLITLGMVRNARHPVDVMTAGEVLDVADDEVAGTLAAGTNVFAIPATGALTITPTSNIYVGFMVEVDRLIVRMANDFVVL